jgi:hypothetical protein
MRISFYEKKISLDREIGFFELCEDFRVALKTDFSVTIGIAIKNHRWV